MKQFFRAFLYFPLLLLAIWSLSAFSGNAARDIRSEPQPVDTKESTVSNASDASIRAANQAQIDQILEDHPRGKQISDNKIAWDEGAVVLVLPTLQDVHGCPSGWFCFYEHIDFGGRRLQFSDCSPGGTTQYLRDWGFENQTSSWVVNRSLDYVNVNDFESGENLWNAESHSLSSWVGEESNDKADWFICYD